MTNVTDDARLHGYPKFASIPIALAVLLFPSLNAFAEQLDNQERFDVVVYGLRQGEPWLL